MKIRNDGNEEWKSDKVSNETGNNITIKSEESDHKPTTTTTAEAEIKITFHRPKQRQKNGSIMRKLLRLSFKRNQNHEEKS
jgi:hypothetical protein